jgi:hypothetical protein
MKPSIAAPSTLTHPDALEALGAALARVVAELAAPIAARLVQERTPSPPPAPAPLVDMDGLTAALGVSVTTVRRMVKEGCPVERYGKSARFDVAAVRAWARERGPKSVTPPRKAPSPPAGPIPGVELKSRKGRG